MELSMTAEEFTKLQDEALAKVLRGGPVLGENGAFTELLKKFVESALEAEIEAHLTKEERANGNKRNGYGKKKLQTSLGTIDIEPPFDRHSTFDPQIVKKRESIMAESFSHQILSLYSSGMSTRDISKHIEELYGSSISASTISEITDKIIPEIKQWQSRPLESVYPIVFLDAIHFKVREDGQVKSKAIYSILGVNRDGMKEILGLYSSENESSRHWLEVLSDLKNRGLEDICIACIDNLSGFAKAIESIFPQCEIQPCVIHQIRNSNKYVSDKDRKEFNTDLRTVYGAVSKDLAEFALDKFEEKWGKKHPSVIRSWRNNWDLLSNFFKYEKAIRKMIYTTNIVEGYHRQLRQVSKNKGSFSTEMSLLKLLYLKIDKISKSAQRPISGWRSIYQQLEIHFGAERLNR